MNTEVRLGMALMFLGSVLLPKKPPIKSWLASQTSRTVLVSQEGARGGSFVMDDWAGTRLRNYQNELVWN